jgi:hypothetical protein
MDSMTASMCKIIQDNEDCWRGNFSPINGWAVSSHGGTILIIAAVESAERATGLQVSDEVVACFALAAGCVPAPMLITRSTVCMFRLT